MRNNCKPYSKMDSEARELQQAIEAGHFEAVSDLAAAYRRSVVLALARTKLRSERCALLQQARELLNRELQLAKARRAHLGWRLASAEAHRTAFEAPRRAALHTWEIEG